MAVLNSASHKMGIFVTFNIAQHGSLHIKDHDYVADQTVILEGITSKDAKTL